MNHFKKFIPFILSFFAMILVVSSGFGMFFYWKNDGDKESLTLTFDEAVQGDAQDEDIIVDDIAENYSFAQDLSAANYYDVYFFCQPYAATYASSPVRNLISGTVTKTLLSSDYTEVTGDLINGTNYVIGGTGGNSSSSAERNYYLYGTTDKIVKHSKSTISDVDESYLWTYNNYTFKNLSLDLYLNIDGSSNNVQASLSDTALSFTINQESEGRYYFKYKKEYLNDATSKPLTWSSNDENCKFALYKEELYYNYVLNIDGKSFNFNETEGEIYSFTYNNKTVYFDTKTEEIYTESYASDPVSFYDRQISQKSPSYKNDKYGFWGHLDGTADFDGDGNSCDKGVPVYTDDSDNMTKYGYKKFTNVYKKFSTSDYVNNKLSQCACSWLDKSMFDFWAWINSFVGFTYKTDVAQNSMNFSTGYGGTAPTDSGDFFDINKPLKNYDTDGDNKIYLYAVYTTGFATTSDHSAEWIRLANDASDTYDAYKGDPDQPYIYQWLFLQNSTKSYLSSYNVYVQEEHSSKNDNPVTFYKSRNYIMKYKGNSTSGWNDYNSLNINDLTYNGKTLKETLITGCYYNFYMYYGTNVSTLKTNASLNKKTIVFINTSGDYTFAAERIYDYRLTGDVANNDGSYDTVKNLYQFSESDFVSATQSGSNTIITYDTNEISFFDVQKATFAINFNQIYDTTKKIPTYQIDENAPTSNTQKTGYECYQPNTNKVFYTNPSGENVYYETSKISEVDTENLIGDQNLPVVKMTGAGTYKFRIKVTYDSSTGTPSTIDISAAFLRGKFIEIHETNPTTNIFSNGTDTGFIDHTDSNPYTYIASFSENGTVGFDSAVFYQYSYSNGKYKLASNTAVSLKSIVGSNLTLIDHVDGRNTITSEGFVFSGSGTTTTSDTFKVKKNYVFYSSTGSLN